MAKREYVEANKRWLEEKAKEEGVKALPRGIYYKVLKSGDPKGAQPNKRSIVTAHYTGYINNIETFLIGAVLICYGLIRIFCE